ncbi:MAG: dephospho-CoA kinase [Flavobacterium sp. BFFFF2]|nr:MAG: dephospho-CoA kinase [Flavobacterium sp. BFFFF2]
MSQIIGLTGGIGSGKTSVAKLFEAAGIPIYIADIEAKKAYLDPHIRAQIAVKFGTDVLTPDGINANLLAAKVFENKEALQWLNALIHPFVKHDFEQWKFAHAAQPWLLKEAAILFETGGHLDCDVVITVTAPLMLRQTRVFERDGTSKEAFEKRVAQQWTDDKKLAMSTYAIQNIDWEDTKAQVEKIIDSLLKI